MKKQQGFTLIELIVVIVILGILAATALPKFVDLTKDANIAVLTGIEGAAASAGTMIYGKALLAVPQQTGATGAISANGATVTLAYGYPDTVTATGICSVMQDNAGATCATNTWTLKTNCTKTYVPPTALGGVATFTEVTTGC